MKFIQNRVGATAIEYVVIMALISVVMIAGLTFLGSNLNQTFSNIGSGLSQSTDQTGGDGGDDGVGPVGSCNKNGACTN